MKNIRAVFGPKKTLTDSKHNVSLTENFSAPIAQLAEQLTLNQ